MNVRSAVSFLFAHKNDATMVLAHETGLKSMELLQISLQLLQISYCKRILSNQTLSRPIPGLGSNENTLWICLMKCAVMGGVK